MNKTITDKKHLDIVLFYKAANEWLSAHTEETKLFMAIKRVLKRNIGVIDRYNESVNDILLNNCAVDPKTQVILKDQNGEFCFTVEKQKKANEERHALLNAEVEVECCVVSDALLTDSEKLELQKGDWKPIFGGFVIAENVEVD